VYMILYFYAIKLIIYCHAAPDLGLCHKLKNVTRMTAHRGPKYEAARLQSLFTALSIYDQIVT
jgi:hypothetical protein